MRRMVIQLAASILIATSALTGFVPVASAVSCPAVGGAPSYTVTPAPSRGVDWEGCTLNNANLTDAFLYEANLTDAHLRRTNLAGADLTGANLTRTFLYEANLTGANLTGANLTLADLIRTNLTGANLTGADLTHAYLRRTDLTGANLTGANLTGALHSEPDLTGANLTGANLTGALLFEANLTGANLTGADLTGAYLSGTNLTGANLTGADLTGASLIRTNLTGAFVTCSTTGILGTGLDGGGDTLPVGWALTSGTLTVPISACPSPSSGSSSAPEPVIYTLTLDFTAQEASCKGDDPSGVQGTWVKLHSADECVQTGPRNNVGAVLLGWSTSSDFPVALARSQVAKGWGVIDDTINGVRMIFIPAGMSTFVSGDNKLVPIWGP